MVSEITTEWENPIGGGLRPRVDRDSLVAQKSEASHFDRIRSDKRPLGQAWTVAANETK